MDSTISKFKTYNINDYLIMALMLFAFFINISEKSSTIFILIMTFLSILNFKNLSFNSFIKIRIFFFLFTLFLLHHLIFDDAFSIKVIEKRFSLLVIPLVFSVVKISLINRTRILKAFVFGVLFASLLNLLEPFYNDFNWHTFNFLEIANKKKIFFYKQPWMNHFYSIHFSNFMDRSYYAVFLNIAISIVLFYLNWDKKIKFLFILYFVAHIFLVNSLMGIIGLAMLIVLLILKEKKAFLLMLMPFFAFISIQISPRLNSYLTQVKVYFLNYDKIPKNFLNYRWQMWKASVELIKENPLLGYGKDGFDSAFNTKLHENVGWSYNILDNVGFNSHNQYFQIFGEIGLLGVTLFIALFILFIRKIIKEKSKDYFLHFSFILLFMLFAVSESFLNRYIGISIFTFFYCFFQFSYNNKKGNISFEKKIKS